jgi:hypothetical protein
VLNVTTFTPGLLLRGFGASAVALLACAFTTNTGADAATTKRLLSCKEAASVVKGAGYWDIRTRSCGIPYTFSARKNDCTFMINVTADGRWVGYQTGCETTISGPVDSRL